MKTNLLFLFLGTLFFFAACETEDTLFEVMPQSDIIALEGMDESFNLASIYNDSLAFCADELLECDSETLAHYDDIYHQHDDLFELHHQNYSHNNMDDDHHHEGNNNIMHGDMMGHDGDDDHDDGDGDHEMGHTMETFEMMMELREHHDEIHPK